MGFRKIHLPLGFTPGSVLAFSLFAGTVFVSLPMTLINIYKSYRLKSGKMRPVHEALRPLFSFVLAFVLCQIWVSYSRNGILESDVRSDKFIKKKKTFFFVDANVYRETG